MTEYRGIESTPELDEVLQVDDEYSIIKVPVKVVEVCEPITANVLPSRECIMRSFIIGADETVQILGRDLRRSSTKVWAVTSEATATNIYIGTNLGEVEQGTAALLPVMLDDLSIGSPFILPMTHTKEMWVRNTHTGPVMVSVVSEYWAD